MNAQLHATNLTIERAGSVVVRDVSLTIAPGDRVGLVGPNGVGKSTLLTALAGRIAPTAGSVSVVPAETTVGLLGQELDARSDETVASYLARRTGVADASSDLDRAAEALADGTDAAFERHRLALDRWMRLGGADLDARMDAALSSVGLDPGDRSAPDLLAADLSGGERARVGLAALILARYDVLLLDEPTNNLDGPGLRLLEERVMAERAPTVVVSHDRRFLERIVNAVVELDHHERTATQYSGSWTAYLEGRRLAADHAARRYADYEGERSRLNERAQQQRLWATKGLRAERTPPDNDRAARGARIDRTEKLAAKARQTERAIDRLEEVDKPWVPWRLQFEIGEAERSGDLVAELADAEVALGNFDFGPVSFALAAGDRLSVAGDNGQGKTTFVRTLLGQLPLDRGHHRLGRSVRMGWLDQERLRLVGPGSVVEEFCTDTGVIPSEARSILAKFGLTAEHLARPSLDWSPGERTRLVLAAFQATGVNTVVLDEPTNHLDLPAIEQLEAALERFTGTVVLITHDRVFLDTVSLTRSVTIVDGRIESDGPA